MLKASHAAMSADEAFAKEYREFFAGMLWYLPFLLAGCIHIMKNKMTRDWGIALFSMWLITFAAGERFGDVPVQLPAYAFICIIVASGMKALLYASRHKSRVLAAAVGLYCLLALTVSGGITGRQISMTACSPHRVPEFNPRSQAGSPSRFSRGRGMDAGHSLRALPLRHIIYGLVAEYRMPCRGVGIAHARGKRGKVTAGVTFRQGDMAFKLRCRAFFHDLTEQGYPIEPFHTIYRAVKKHSGVNGRNRVQECRMQ